MKVNEKILVEKTGKLKSENINLGRCGGHFMQLNVEMEAMELPVHIYLHSHRERDLFSPTFNCPKHINVMVEKPLAIDIGRGG